MSGIVFKLRPKNYGFQIVFKNFPTFLDSKVKNAILLTDAQQ